jgi:hypothetical protein
MRIAPGSIEVVTISSGDSLARAGTALAHPSFVA